MRSSFISCLKFLAWGWLCLYASTACAQSDFISEPTDAVYDTFLPVYTHHMGSFAIHTQGWSIGYEYGFGRNPHWKHTTSLDMSLLKDRRELATVIQITRNNRVFNARYVYGKQSAFYPIHLAYGRTYTIGLPHSFRGVQLNVFYKGGLTFGIIKPYVLRILVRGFPAQERAIVYSAKDSVLFLDETRILGTDFSLGWDQVRINLGLNVSGGVRVNFAPMIKGSGLGILGIEAAAHMDLQTRRVPLLVPFSDKKADFFFLQGRIALIIGGLSRRPSHIKRAGIL